jgi:hypothetical protein
MADDPDKSNARSAIILMALIVALAIYSSAYGMQTLQWLDAHRWASADPWLKDVPQPLANTAGRQPATPPAPVPLPGSKSKPTVKIQIGSQDTTLSAYNYQFDVPWTGKFKENASPAGAEFRFESGQVVIFGDPDAQIDIVNLIRTSQTNQYAPFQTIVNDNGISTNYALYQAVYGSSPSQVSPTTSYANAQRNRTLLLTKLAFGPDLDRNIYSFEFGNNRGFQFGDPAAGPVAVRVFNSRDKQFRLLFTAASNSNAVISQEAINQAIQTLEVVPMETR